MVRMLNGELRNKEKHGENAEFGVRKHKFKCSFCG